MSISDDESDESLDYEDSDDTSEDMEDFSGEVGQSEDAAGNNLLFAVTGGDAASEPEVSLDIEAGELLGRDDLEPANLDDPQEQDAPSAVEGGARDALGGLLLGEFDPADDGETEDSTPDGDILLGSSGDDDLFGTDDDDTIDGGAGDDNIWAREGQNLVYGGDGDDEIYGGYAEGSLLQAYGGAGDDVFIDSEGDSDLYGGAGDDLFQVGHGHNEVHGGEGNDTVFSGRDTDIIYGGAGNDVLHATGTSIEGEVDQVYGGDGDDLIIQRGSTETYGGAGADHFQTYVNTWVDTASTVMDYDPTEDSLEIQIEGHGYQQIDDFDVRVEDYADGSGASVFVDGVEILKVEGAAGLTVADLELTVVETVYQ